MFVFALVPRSSNGVNLPGHEPNVLNVLCVQARLVSKQFKELSDEEKKKYEDLANEDRTRYTKEMETYKPPTGMEPKGKPKYDGPKKPTTSFVYFSQQNRAKIRQANMDISFGDLVRSFFPS